MKRLLSVIISVSICFSVAMAGDVNVDGGGGGGTGSGTGSNNWVNGEDGVRVTVIREKDKQAMGSSVDFANKKYTVNFYFGNKSKIYYRNAGINSLKPVVGSSYKNIINTTLPRIVSASGTNSIDVVKKYFSLSGTIKDIAINTGFNYDTLINGEYVLLLEPLIYFTYNNVKYVATATEVALLDSTKNGDLAKKMGSLTHQNLPRSMYLIDPALGFAPPSKPFPNRSTNAQIFNSLGLGTVHFRDLSPGDGSGVIPNPMAYTYRTSTEVITSIKVYTGQKQSYTPDKMGEVTFNILGNTYTKKFICPENSEELVYVRWTTPDKPIDFNIAVNVNGNISNIAVKIIELVENTPPDPKFEDVAPKINLNNIPTEIKLDNHEWTQWRAYWQEDWKLVQTSNHTSEWLDLGWWVYTKENFSASVRADIMLYPNKRVKTAFSLTNQRYELKSGYGVDILLESKKNLNGASSYDVTNYQNARVKFPEFQFRTYDRLLEKDKENNLVFKENEFSNYKERVHFTPLRYPDNTKYAINVEVFDAWTPVGELKTSVNNDKIEIVEHVYDDWYIRPLRD